MKNSEKTLDMIVNLCKNRGFIYPGSEIYGGLANSWDYGPVSYTHLDVYKRQDIARALDREGPAFLTIGQGHVAVGAKGRMAPSISGFTTLCERKPPFIPMGSFSHSSVSRLTLSGANSGMFCREAFLEAGGINCFNGRSSDLLS